MKFASCTSAPSVTNPPDLTASWYCSDRAPDQGTNLGPEHGFIR